MEKKLLISFKLNESSLKNLPFERYERDFTFIVDGKRYETTRFVADILSPKICEMHFTDASNKEYVINTSHRKEEEFEKFLKLCNFETREITVEEAATMSEYFLKLGNIDSYSKLFSINNTTKEDNDEYNIEIIKAISREMKKNKSLTNTLLETENIQKLIKKVSGIFYKMKETDIKELEIEILEEIIRNEELKIEDEDSLMNKIMNFYETDHSYSYLFEYVIFNNLSKSKLEQFINEFDYTDLTHNLWKSICSIISIKEKESFNKNKRYIKSQKEESNENIKAFLHEEGKEFEGIMRYLSKTSGSNIHDNGTIQITTNSIHGNNHPKNLVNYKTDNYYQSEDNKLATICFDFKNQPIQLTSYSIKSNGNSGKSNYDLKSWVIEVSNDVKNGKKLIVMIMMNH